MQLRYLQTVAEIAAENNSTTIFPIPIELFRPWIQAVPAAPTGSVVSAVALPAGDATRPLPSEIQKVLAPSVVTEGGMPAAALADMMQQFRVEWAQRRARHAARRAWVTSGRRGSTARRSSGSSSARPSSRPPTASAVRALRRISCSCSGKEVGIPPRFLQQALAEERSRLPEQVPIGMLDRLAGRAWWSPIA